MPKLSIDEAVREVQLFVGNGLNLNCIEHVQSTIDQFGENSHEIFQEAAEIIHTLIAEGVIESAAQADSLSA